MLTRNQITCTYYCRLGRTIKDIDLGRTEYPLHIFQQLARHQVATYEYLSNIPEILIFITVLLDEIDGSNRLSPRLRLPGRLRLRLRDDGEAIEAPLAAEEKVVQQMARARPVRALVNRPSRPPRRKVGRDSSDYRIPFGIRTRVLQILHDVTLAARISPPMCRPTPSAKAAAPPGGGHRVMVRRKTLLVTTGSTDVLSKSAETRTSVVASTIQSGPPRPRTTSG